MAASRGNPVTNGQATPKVSHDAVLKPSAPVPEGVPMVDGPEFNDYDRRGMDITAAELVASMANMGFQSTAIGEATRIINDMVCAIILHTLQKLNF